ncbi:fungal specific transcription factor [Fusarium sp. NRRL 25303]|nr:fungal specific transcription factor [Fusarium sp. NRRL 25303]
MFESFLKQQHQGTPGRSGIVLPGEPSPLTFALGEFQHRYGRGLHHVGRQIEERASVAEAEHGVHPPHLAECDIAWLKAKGAFDHPDDGISDTLLRVYLERFHHLYSIVRKDRFETAFRQRKLPWIILHAVCFISVTFCDRAVIYQSQFMSRLEARLYYYNKAKALFTMDYETDRLALLKAVIMLSFCGPQLQSHWSPGSWIGFGVTIAVSLGLHRATGSARANSSEDRGLLRRLWWTLVNRDAHLSALLGRSMRVNLSLCDTDLLTLNDFEDEMTCSHQNDLSCICKQPIHYQIQMAKLSIILRRILLHRFGPTKSTTTVEELHQRIVDWQSKLPSSFSSGQQASNPFVPNLVFKILFNYHLLILHMERPERISSAFDHNSSLNENRSVAVAQAAASAIASTAVTIMKKSIIYALPHEVFPAFFLAGIIFYRQASQHNPAIAENCLASLDNCQIVLNEARESWDSGNWATKLFEFLLSTSNETDEAHDAEAQQATGAHTGMQTSLNTAAAGINYPMIDLPSQSILPSIDASTRFDESGPFELGDLLLMPNLWLPEDDELQTFTM